MSEIDKVNGHRPSGLLHLLDPSLKLGPHPQQNEVDFDLEKGLASVVHLSSTVPEEAFSARTLGTEREGNAILIGNDNILVTIGYLVVDAQTITLKAKGENKVQAELVGYNHESGLALIQTLSDLGIPPIKQGTAVDLEENERVIITAYGGIDHSISASVTSRREFAGSWEYLLDRAIFTTPIHPNWSGAALIRRDGTLCGVGSLWVNDAEKGQDNSPGNMFVPIDLLQPIYNDMISTGLAQGPNRPWLGMYTAEAMNRLFVSGVIPNAPADSAGVEIGDLITGLEGERTRSLSDMYRKLWSLGDAGVTVILNLNRDGEDVDIKVKSDSRYNMISKRRNH